jgi:hypothetical protein
MTHHLNRASTFFQKVVEIEAKAVSLTGQPALISRETITPYKDHTIA